MFDAVRFELIYEDAAPGPQRHLRYSHIGWLRRSFISRLTGALADPQGLELQYLLLFPYEMVQR